MVNKNAIKMHQGDIVNVLGVAGSMRKGSLSTHALKLVLDEAKKYGSDSRVLELREVKLPIYDPSRSVSEELYRDVNGNREIAYPMSGPLKLKQINISLLLHLLREETQ